jgi:hypothetical protein
MEDYLFNNSSMPQFSLKCQQFNHKTFRDCCTTLLQMARYVVNGNFEQFHSVGVPPPPPPPEKKRGNFSGKLQNKTMEMVNIFKCGITLTCNNYG